MIEKNNEVYDYDMLFKCECDGHYLRVTQFKGEEQISILKFNSGSLYLSFLKRVKLAIGYIFNPRKYDIHDGIIFSNATAKILGRELIKITQPKNSDIITGRNNG